jgi:putative transposase
MATRKKHTPEQVVRKLATADRMLGEGKDVADVCRELQVSEQTYYRWRNQFGGLKADDAKRLKGLEEWPPAPHGPGKLAGRSHDPGGVMEERIVVADPVADPKGYQRELLALLGGRDPVAVLAGTPTAVEEQTAGLDERLLGRPPAAGEWSVTELLGHLWDAEIAYSFRARAILAQDTPHLAGYDQVAWATLPKPPHAALLAAFSALRAANLALARQVPAPAWERVGVHAERGALSFRLLTEEIAGHDRAHLLQLEQTIAAVRR